MYRRYIVIGVVVLAVCALVFYTVTQSAKNTPVEETPSLPPKLLSKATFICREGKMIDVNFLERTDTPPSTTTPPTPPGFVRLSFTDGRSFDLPQTVSADGARYANQDESFVFWNRGNGAQVLDNGGENTYRGCVLLSAYASAVRLPVGFVSDDALFSLRLPNSVADDDNSFTVDQAFQNHIAPSTTISGVRFTIPKRVASDTSLMPDTFLSVERLPDVEHCTADLFFDGTHATATMEGRNVTYSIASSSNAGAGNTYTETVHAILDSRPCVAIRYSIHTRALEDDASGTTTEYGETSIKTLFDAIRDSVVFNI